MAKKTVEKPITKLASAPSNLSQEEDFAWTFCAFMASEGHEAEPAYENADENNRGQLIGIRVCDNDDTVVPVGITVIVARPHVSVNGVTVLRGGEVNRKAMLRLMAAIFSEKPKVAVKEKAAQKAKSYNKDFEDVKSYLTTETGWGISTDYGSQLEYEAVRVNLVSHLTFKLSLNDLMALKDAGSVNDLQHALLQADNTVRRLIGSAREAYKEKQRAQVEALED